ncbi:MAG: PKD domain-containing protein, partial [Paludibacteraceae bacterium]|nr:PKD domain-containing protein [Paludibacteraceae bacterium]
MKRNLLILLTFLLPLLLWAEKPTTEGTEFWLTFMNNYRTSSGSSEMELKLIFSSRQNTTVMVQNPQTGWSQSMQVSANTIAEMVVPRNQCYTYSAETVEKRGLVITSSSPIALYASNFREHTYDATIVLPINGIGTDYVIQAYENVILVSGDKFPREFAVVATEDGTQVTITPHARTTGGKLKNVPFTISLNKGETYQVMSEDTGNDFSGSRVESNKLVAVFSGHSCVNIPTGNPWCDHIVEQQTPTLMWGKQFVVTKTSGQSGDRVMVTAREDGTQVKVNGAVRATLRALESYEFRLTDNSAYIETNSAAACYLYLEGATANNNIGDPSSVHITPLEQQIERLTFATFQTSISRTHFVNIVTTAAGAASITLDGQSIASQFQPVTGNSQYRYAQIHISHGTHTLQTTKDGFVGHVYGLGHCESYAYTFGSSTIPLEGQILVNDEPRTDIDYNETRCYKEPITFSPHTNVEFTAIKWDLGDGTTSTKPTVTHTYAAPGDYRVQMTVENTDGRDTAYTNLHLVSTLRDTVYATICDGDKYTIAGQEFSSKGKHNVTLTSAGGCDSIVTLILDVAPTYFKTEEATVNKGMSYRWHWKWFREEGYYRDTLTSSQGCDSIFELHLTLNDPTEIMHDTICYQPTYTFHDHEFALPSVEAYKDKEYVDYTLEYRDNVNCITYQMLLAISPGSGDVTLNDTIQEGQTYDFFGDKLTLPDTYRKTISKGAGCEQEYTLNLVVLPFPIIKTEAVLCTSDSYEFRGKFYDKSGVYNDTVFTPAGIEAIYRLTLTDTRSHTDISVQTTGSYEFNGTVYTESTTVSATFTNVAGCDSIVTLHLGIGEPCQVTEEINMTLCDGEHIPWNGIDCEAGNTYTKKLKSSGGCDSIATLVITALPKQVTNIEVEVCSDEYYMVGTERLRTEGPHTVILQGSNGCDSIVNVNITRKNAYSEYFEVTIEEGQEYLWDGDAFTKKGDYIKGYSCVTGCDSIVTMHLNVVPPHCVTTKTLTEEVCFGEPYDFYGELLDKSSTYTHLVENADCDTMVTLNLTVLPKVEDVHIEVSIAEGDVYPWHGADYSEADVYEYPTTDAHGCPYTEYLHLTVIPHCVTTKTLTEEVCFGEPYDFYGELLDKSSTYTHLVENADCDTMVTLNLTVLPKVEDVHLEVSIAEGGTYKWHGADSSEADVYEYPTTDAHGCPYTEYLHLTVIPHCVTAKTLTEEVCFGEPYDFYGELLDKSSTYTHLVENADC